MAYVSDLKNHDARTEGLSYGMMAAVQLNKKEVFDRLWHWTKVYMHHQGGARDAYFAWSVEPKTGKHNAEGYFDPHNDGLRHLFSLMHLSGNYPIINP
jgi:oligosaccharide reducing-end xylanase